MAKKKNKKKTAPNRSGLLLVKRKSKTGYFYTVNIKTGERVPNIWYKAQFTSRGKNTKEARDLTLKLLEEKRRKKEPVTEKDIKRIAEKNYLLSVELREEKRKQIEREKEATTDKLTMSTNIFSWEIRDYILRANWENYFLRKSGESKYIRSNKARFLEKIEPLVEIIHLIVKKYNGEKGKNIYIRLRIFENLTGLYIDLSNRENIIIINADESEIEEIKTAILSKFF